MTAYKLLSEYFSEDNSRSATIRLILDKNRVYNVTVTNDSGHAFTATFENEDDAEGFAEEWVQR
jgi:hypothetical protein